MKQKYDLIIIGGGILGTFHAYHALKENKSVLQLEKDNYAVGSTVRNFGQVVPSGMEDKWFEYGRTATNIYKEIQADFDISVRQNGSLYLASDDDEVQLLHELKKHYDGLDYDSSLLTKESTLAKHPTLKGEYVKEALFFPQEVSVEPDLMIHRLQRYMVEKFPQYNIIYNTLVISCESVDGEVLTSTNKGEKFTSDKAIICNGYEFKLLFPDLFLSSGIVISKLQMMRTVSMPEVNLEGNILTGLTTRRYESFEHHCPSFKNISTPAYYEELIKWGIHILFKKAVDGSFIIGDSHEYANVDQFDDLGFNLKQYVNELMLTEAQKIVNFDVRQIQHYWAGFYPQHPTKHIVEYDIDNRIHIRTAIGGKGMTASAGYAGESIKAIFG
ncbi:TIGR03364 family FAD-dependent oxidoreductase [Pedobacter sp. MC2016-05]|uniref:TIGR03364 family FAD-dependent oxidoreductase n=1 Tax=Pedobacter sp. MC2016-05 TaxID=2994474 RepID=UPI0022483910|nr:TIGR03364 family FAD-dependent oxidoreductase [Pedobacter sp. MC2016-05]MCX2476982.1 TIGR03364 family FAD-dependent oxidoreductase [Pedobacter sp. MC2016-05]